MIAKHSPHDDPAFESKDAAELYLELMRSCLTRTAFQDQEMSALRLDGWRRPIWKALKRILGDPDLALVKPRPATPEARHARIEGRGAYSRYAETIISHDRLRNVQDCITTVLADGVEGDLLEAGVQRGGCTIFMRAVLAAYGVHDRRVWLADTFTGLPVPDADTYPADAGFSHLTGKNPKVIGLEGVKANFSRYGLLDDNVRFIVGLFKDSLPEAPLEQLAVIRLDADLYSSTMEAITHLYPKLSIGGYLIVDDYNSPKWSEACGQAIRDYRAEHDISETMHEVDWNAVYWRRER